MSRLVGYGVSQVPTNGMLGGMAYQDPSNISVGNISAGSYDNGLWTSEKTFNVQFPTGTLNQKVQIYWPTGSRLQGGYEVTITTGFEYASASGMLRKTFGVHLAENGGYYVQKTTVPFALGNIASWFTISDIQWDSTNSRWYLIIANLAGTPNGGAVQSGNTVSITVKSHIVAYNSSVWLNARASATSISSIYSTDTTVYPILSAPITDNNGNFIIGAATSTGTVSQPLQVTGGAYVSGFLGVGSTIKSYSSSESLEVKNGYAAFINPSATVAPIYAYNTDTTSSTNQPYITLSDGSGNRGAVGVNYTDSALWIHGQNGIRFRGGGSSPGTTEWGRFDSNGNLGIGSTQPSTKLDVNGNIRMNAVPGTNTNADLPVLFQTSAGTIDGGSSLTFNPGGDVLSVNGAVISSQQFRGSGSFVSLTTANGSGTAQYEATDTTLTLKTGATERLKIDSSGRLLVNTSTAPGAGELLRVEKASTGTEGAGIRFGGTYTIADAGTQTISVGNGTLVFVSENSTGDGALFFCTYKSATVTLISDPNSRYANAVTAGRISLTKSANSLNATLTNNSGASRSFTIGKINNSD
jgi:hypothetical protein